MSRCYAVLLAVARAASGFADQAASLELFEKHVRPTLLDQCIRCHGAKKQQAGLRLDSREAILKGGDSGPTVKPGDPQASLLLKALRYDDVNLEMPPRGKLPDKTIAAFEKWIQLGAHDPRTSDATGSTQTQAPSVQQGRSFWSFQPIGSPTVPETHGPWAVTEIDHFILSRMQQQKLVACSRRRSSNADPSPLLRSDWTTADATADPGFC